MSAEEPELGVTLTAMVTPFDAGLRVNENVAAALMHHCVDQGTDGLVICGPIDESATLSTEERLRMIRLAVQEVGDRCVVVAGSSPETSASFAAFVERATELGANAILSGIPSGYEDSGLPRRGLQRHFETVAGLLA